MIEGYELSKYLDKTTIRIIDFLHKSKSLYSYNEDGNKLLKYSYLNFCLYNRDNDEINYTDLLEMSCSEYNVAMEISNWSIDYKNYEESIKRKCNWCNIELRYCPIKVYADLKNFATHNKMSVDKLIERLLNEPNIKTISNEILERRVANRILFKCKEYSKLRLAKLLIDTKLVQWFEKYNSIITYKYIDMRVTRDSFINNLANYYNGTGCVLEGKFNLDEKKEWNIFELAAYINFTCLNEKIDYNKVFEILFAECDNVFESRFDTYYRWYIKQINELDCNEEAKTQIKEVITYIRNYHTKYYYHLPNHQIILAMQIEDEKLLEKISMLIYRFATNCGYIKEKTAVIDTEFLHNKNEKDADILNTVDKLLKESGMIVVKDLDKISLSKSKMENMLFALDNRLRVYDRNITIISSKNDVLDMVKGYPGIANKIQHNIKFDIYSVAKIQEKVLKKLRANHVISKDVEENIRKIIEDDYSENELRNNDYIQKIYEDILYRSYNTIDVSENINNDRILTIGKKHITEKKSLDDLIGLEEIKREVNKFKNFLMYNNRISQKIENKNLNMNMLFLGNPGTGKTTVANIMADILYELNYIKRNKFLSVTAKDLVAEYIGQTAIKTSKIIESALDGVLFIDEAYSIVSSNRNASFGEECIATLVEAMEKYRDRLVVIFAGYTEEMKRFLNLNPGIASRIGYTFEFGNYSTDELIQIIENYAGNKGFSFEESAKNEIRDIIDVNKNTRNFGNARFMINLFEKLVMVHAQNYDEEKIMEITKRDVINLRDDNFSLKKGVNEIKEQFGQLVGLNGVKKQIDGLIDLVEFNNRLEKRIPLNLNMVFVGNPGTGKTTVARILAEILYNLGYIKNNKLIEVMGKDLIGEYVGQTAVKTAKVLENALDGLLFIDEAYTLMNQSGDKSNFSQDAISTITKYMTDYEGRLTIIFAGYKEEMKNFLEVNSGLVSRVGETIEFDDFNEDELLKIFVKEIEKINFTIDEPAKEKVLQIIRDNKSEKNFGNARFALNLFKKTMVEHAKRCKNMEDDEEIKRIIVEDVPKIKVHRAKRIGF